MNRRRFLAAATAPALASPPLTVKARKNPSEPWAEYPTRTVSALPGFVPQSVKTGRYGGRTGRTLKATGFFRVAKEDGRFWLVDPEGHPYFHQAVVSVAPGKSKRNVAALKDKFGTEDRWAAATVALLRENGFTGTGNWSATDILRKSPDRLVYTVTMNLMAGFGRSLKLTHQQPGHTGFTGNAIPVFHPDFSDWCDREARRIIEYADDPWALGYFSDNELACPPDLLEKSLALDPSNPALKPGYDAAVQWKRKNGTAEGFLEHVYDRYFEITTKAIRKYDPHHLCLGSRFHGTAVRSAGMFRAASRHLDVISANVYRQWSPDAAMLAVWRAEASKPVMVTEFYAKGDDAGFANSSGAGWIVPTQKDRALFYQNFVLGLIESRLCVGWHWFKYMDNDPDDLTTDPSNRDSNKGIVNIRYEPYRALLDNMRPLNDNAYALAAYFDKGGAA